MEEYDGRSYDPEGMKRAYDKLEHGRARMEAIRSAIKAADTHADNPYRIFFRKRWPLSTAIRTPQTPVI